MKKPTAILLLHCPDQQGIISEVTRFITDNQGNIVYLDQYVDKQDGMFFMRIEWELENFLIPQEKIQEYINTLYAQRYQMTCKLYFSDKRPRMAIFVSKMSHCLYDLLARWKAGEWEIDIPCIVSNHEDLRYVAEQFDIPYYVFSIKKDHSNKAEVEAAEMELLKKNQVTFIVLARYMQIISDEMIAAYPNHIITYILLPFACHEERPAHLEPGLPSRLRQGNSGWGPENLHAGECDSLYIRYEPNRL